MVKRIRKIGNGKKILVGVILFCGFIIRLVYLIFLKNTVYFDPYIMDKHDQKTFILWAEDILRHPFYVDGKVFYMAPFYPYFLSMVYFFVQGNLFGIYFIQILLDVFLCFIIYLLGKLLVDDLTGIVACFLCAFYRTFVVYSSSILSDNLITLLYISFITSIYIALQKKNLLWWIISGVLLGFSALAKPTIGIFIPFLFIGLLIYPETKLISGKMSSVKNKIFIFFILIFISGCVILPITIRNWYIGKVFVPICSNGPENWRIGNSSDSIGLFHYPKGHLLSPSSIQFWKLFLRKIHLFFTSYEWPQNMNVYLMEELIPFLKIAFIKLGFVFPLGISGLFLFFKNFRRNSLFIFFTLSNILWVVLFFITDRYRFPAVACFFITSSYLIVWSKREIFNNKKLLKPFLFFIFSFLFAYFFNVIPGDLLPEESKKIFGYLSAKGIEKDLRERKIKEAYKKALDYLKILPNDPKSNFLMALVYYDMGDKQKMLEYLYKTLEIDPGFTLAKRFLEDISKNGRHK
ncbi:MAG: glycosyltransferase family 39 protein [Candidatus Omnitrophica bacterium]|nr:glycosyltransferase family 39 protein [Candidatus Omnitrophota bacterium]